MQMTAFIEGLVKDAKAAGSVVQFNDNGREEKLAMALPPELVQYALRTLGGAGVGAIGGGLAGGEGNHGKGALLGALAGGAGATFGAGNLANSVLGAGAGSLVHDAHKQAALVEHYNAGAQRAKQAFLGPMLGMAASALAPTLARGAIGKVAPRVAGAIAKPMMGAMFDTGVGMAANKALGG